MSYKKGKSHRILMCYLLKHLHKTMTIFSSFFLLLNHTAYIFYIFTLKKVSNIVGCMKHESFRVNIRNQQTYVSYHFAQHYGTKHYAHAQQVWFYCKQLK